MYHTHLSNQLGLEMDSWVHTGPVYLFRAQAEPNRLFKHWSDPAQCAFGKDVTHSMILHDQTMLLANDKKNIYANDVVCKG